MDKRIGAQYYTIRDHLRNIEDFDTACQKVSEMGYKIVQISGTPLKAKEMREVLNNYSLECKLTHRDFNDFKKNLDEIIDYNQTLGCELCGIGGMPAPAREGHEELSVFINDANLVSEKLRDAGMYFGYHNHAFEFVKFDGKTLYERLVSETDPDKFMFISDTYWYQVGGKNPADEIRKLGKRAMAVHFKEFMVVKQNWQVPEMCEVGSGNLDWDGIISACEDAGTRWAFVEQDRNWIDNDCLKSLKTSYDFLTTKGFN